MNRMKQKKNPPRISGQTPLSQTILTRDAELRGASLKYLKHVGMNYNKQQYKKNMKLLQSMQKKGHKSGEGPQEV